MNYTNVTFDVGSVSPLATSAGEIYEWGWYNRLLTESEVIYNQNALMKKYGIT
jgi:hypothetical protein